MPAPLSRIRLALVVLAVPSLLTGLWGLLAPRSWYDDFPGTDLGWVSAFGSYNEHFVQDIGSAYLGFGTLLAWAAWRTTRSLARGAAIGYLVFATPHLLVHIFVRETLDTTAYIGTVAPLLFSVLLAAWVAVRAGEDRAVNPANR
ncbi:MAG TPA: hypothetical protein VNB24_03480 [Acidimicrobiales bacterium]|nr:hypothetical protein [Acidimicrobiales bacterium]